MIFPLRHLGVLTRPRRAGVARTALTGIALTGFMLAGAAFGQSTSVIPSTAAPASKPPPDLIAYPAALMAAMARELDKNPDQAVLILGTMTITQSEMADVIRAMPPSAANLGFSVVSHRALDTLVAQKTFVINALREGVDKDPAFTRSLNVLREKALAEVWLARKGDHAVTNDTLHARYDRDIAGKSNPDEVRARVIMVATEDDARAVIAKLQSGADFADLARRVSTDGTAAQGGDLGYVTFEAVTPEIGHIIFALNPGQISAFPERTPSGYLIVRVEGRRQRATPTFEEARPGLETLLRADATRAAIDDVMSHVKILKPPEAPQK
jgi:peptidyl-prolyl cis-trans isomerase C